MMEEIRKPEMTKKTSTPTNPPLKTGTFGKAWKTNTAKTASARKPSMSGRQLMEDLLFEEVTDIIYISETRLLSFKR